MKLTDAQIKKLQDYFAAQKDVMAVYLYGSYVTGNTHRRSDIDFGILFDKPINNFEQLGRIYRDLPKLPIEVDVRDINLNTPPVYLMNVIQGQLLFSRNESRRIQFEVDVFNKFTDTQRYRQIRNSYIKQELKEGMYGY